MKRITLLLILMCAVLLVSAQSKSDARYYEADSVIIREGKQKVEKGHFDIAQHTDIDGEYFVFFKDTESILHGYSSVMSKDTVNGGVMYFCKSSIGDEPVVIWVQDRALVYMYGAAHSRGDSLEFKHLAIFNLK